MAVDPLPPLAHIPASRYAVFALIAVTGAAWDLGTKWWIFRELGFPGRSQFEWRGGELIHFVLETSFNRGALWGMGQGYTGLFGALSVAAAVGILYFLFVHKAARSWWLTVALAFVFAGTLGNLYDRLGLHGWRHDGQPVYAVRDFLHFRFFETFDWAIFNFADTFLVTGAIMLVLQSFWSESPQPAPVATPPAGAPQAGAV